MGSSIEAPPGTGRHPAARALAGLLAAAVVLAVGELVSVPIAAESSPFYAVGSAVVDVTPQGIREWAISTFSTSDKTALFAGIAVVIALVAAAAGIVESRSRPAGSVLLVALGIVGAAAALTRPGSDWTWALPTVVGVAAGVFTLRRLTSALDPIEAGAAAGIPRRRFLALALTAAAVAAVAGVVGRMLAEGRRVVAENRAAVRVPTPTSPAPPLPAGADLPVPGITSLVTPNHSFYRVDTALRVPSLTTDDWRLRIHGMVDREVTLDYAALTARAPIERMVTLTCVSNPVGGDLAGNAMWIGYRLADLLTEAGVHPDADMLLSTSVDGFTAGSPTAALTDGRDAMLAVAMNGEPLPLEHGYPARLVVPGLYGYVSATKWVVDLELTRFDRAEAYWTRRGWSAHGPIKTASRIDVPRDRASVPAGRTTVAGVAWAQHRGISEVQVQVDDGGWSSAALSSEYTNDCWRQWVWDWEAPTGEHTLRVRAVDGSGTVQTGEVADPVPDGATGWDSVRVSVG
ncbi:molybdopterin-dependent oxidoreductase [Rhodococcus spelaei]|uniref:Molybdopterin-dependent oxidoreductase n=1 Tax=Rhodococcus spelaei TaxID=2546320 RepID=A0A541AZU0_9NOCA|nr:molybdopterin-dependent oxidoreductase [Rhodococcus spelaei]TQF65590.1 molybdopterin-dependent oxidoreductase [Rhodococcus spelaei]